MTESSRPAPRLLFVPVSGPYGMGEYARSLAIARMAFNSGMKFQAYLAAAFGIWLGLQAFINMGVNMGILPTKGLTLPLLSYGRSSLLVTLGWLGVVLRVYHEVATSRPVTIRGGIR